MIRRSSRPRNLTLAKVNHCSSDSLVRLYHADAELKAISNELDSFDGKKDPVRCNLLVNQLR